MPILHSPLILHLAWTLLHSLWQGAAICLTTALFLVILRRAQPSLRHFLACLAMAAMLAWPLTSALTNLPDPTPSTSTLAPSMLAPPSLPSATPLAMPHASTSPPAPSPSWRQTLDLGLPYLVPAWAAGVLLLACYNLGGLLAAHRLKTCTAAPIQGEIRARFDALCRRMNLRRPIALLRSAATTTPVVIGYLRPVILFPAALLTGLSTPQLEALLAHELAHIRRHDYLLNLLQVAVETLLFYHPGTWWLSRQIRLERERACDDLAASLTGSPRTLAEALLRIEELRPTLAAPLLAASGSGDTSQLRHRILRLLGHQPRSAVRASWAAFAVALTLLAAVACALTSQPPTPAHSASSSPASAPSGRLITGHVLDAQGNPLPNAVIHASRYDPLHTRLLAGQTRSNPDGSFSLRVHPTTDYLYAILPGAGISVPLRPADNLTLRLASPAGVVLHLLQPDGRPAPSLPITVNLILFPGEGDFGVPFGTALFLPPESAQLLAAVTGPDGACTLTGLPQRGRVRLDVADPRYAHFSFQDDIALGNETPVTKTIPLLPAASIAGRLVHPEGKPLPPMALSAQALSTNPDGRGGMALTSPDGRFLIQQIRPGAYAISLHESGEQSNDWTAAAQIVTFNAGESQSLDMALTQGGILSGQVRDAVSLNGLPNVQVGLYGTAQPREASSVYVRTTDADGRFSFRVPPGTQYPYIMAATENYLTTSDQPISATTVHEGQTTDIHFDLQPDPNPIVEGRVLDDQGHPVANAWISVVPGDRDDRDHFGHTFHTTTNKDGRFRIHAAPRAKLSAQFQKLRTPAPVTVPVTDQPVELKLTRQATFSLTVELVEPDGSPVKNGMVELVTQSGRYGIGSPEIPADAHGRARLDDLALDTTYSVWGRSDAHGVTQMNVKNPAPTDKPEQTLRLKLVRATDLIAGTVLGPDGKPLPNIDVSINGSSTGYRTTRTDAQGRFSFNVPPHARATLAIPNSPFSSGLSAQAGQTSLQLSRRP